MILFCLNLYNNNKNFTTLQKKKQTFQEREKQLLDQQILNFKQKKENFFKHKKVDLSKFKFDIPLLPKAIIALKPKQWQQLEEEKKQLIHKLQEHRLKFKKKQLFVRKKKFFSKKKKFIRKKFKFKANFRYVKLLKKFVFYPKKLRSRFLYKVMLITKQAFLQYYREFSLSNYKKIQKLYKTNYYNLTKFEKFIMFFEMRLTCVLVRIRYAKYTLYSNSLILTGQIRVNGNVILFCDYQIKLFDIVEISYVAFYRQFFKRFLFRKYYKYHFKEYGDVYKDRSRYVHFLMKKKFKQLPIWLFYGVLRVYKTAVMFANFYRTPSNDYFVQSNRVLATIIYKLPKKFKDRKLSNFMTKKHMKFFSNFCTKFA